MTDPVFGLAVYLGGPIFGCTDDEAHGWREEAKPFLEARGHTWVNPMVRDYRGREDTDYAEIVEGDKADIDGCDVMLMACPKPSYGTAMEILYGYERGKRVIAWVPWDAYPVSPWIRYHAEIAGGHLSDALGLIA
jgi:nucleoside 2-deoxyribosyltransferase